MNTVPATVEIPGYLAGTWKADPVHSEIAFSVRHLMLSKVRGRFTGYDVTIVTGEDLLDSSATATIDLASVDTGHEVRDNHLRSSDFFEVEKYPTMTFRSRRVERVGDARYRVVGDLTIRDVTREIVLDATDEGRGRDPWGGDRLAFSATTRIDRSDFGLTWNQALETGGVLVSNEIRITIDVQALKTA